MSETNLTPAYEPSGGGSAIAQAIGFITEFNQNAAIFNGILGPLLGTELAIMQTDIHFLKGRVIDLETVVRRNLTIIENADDPDFQDCAHVAPGDPC